MKMRPVYCALLFILFGCHEEHRTRINLKIPDEVPTFSYVQRCNMPGTKVLLPKLDGYKLVTNPLRLQKNKGMYIDVIEKPTTDYYKSLEIYKKLCEEYIREGKFTPRYYQKEFKLGRYDATLNFGPGAEANSDEMMLMFGSNTFVEIVTGTLPKHNELAAKEMLNNLLDVTVDSMIIQENEPTSLFSLDLSNTSFKYNGTRKSKESYYTVNGAGIRSDDSFANYISVFTQPPFSANEFNIKSELFVKSQENIGEIVYRTTRKLVFINGVQGLETILEGNYFGQKERTYSLVASNGNTGILFIGDTYDATDSLFPQLERIAKTLIIK